VRVHFVDDRVTPAVPQRYHLPYGLAGLGIGFILLFLIFVGWGTTGYVGRVVIRAGESCVSRMPVLRSIYSAIKQIRGTVLAGQSTAFRQVVLVEYPRRGIWAIGFVSARPGARSRTPPRTR